MKNIFLMLALLLGLVIAVAAIINNEVVTVNFLFGQISLTLFMLILGSAFAGALFIGLLGIFRSIHNYMNSQGDRNHKKDLQHQVKDLEHEKKNMEVELSKQRKEQESLAAKENYSLGKEKNKLEDELRKQQKDHEREVARAHKR